MTDFIEIDFIEAGDNGSGDAIAIRRSYNGIDCVYVVDGGYAGDGQKLIDHIRKHYGQSYYINHLVLTHPDADHASGLETVLKQIRVNCLWMNRPWMHVNNLMPMFRRYQDRSRLIARLKNAFPKIAELESIAVDREIEIRDAFQGNTIGEFTVLAPHIGSYLRLVVESDKTPVPVPRLMTKQSEALCPAEWGEENLKGDTEGTSPENETSIVQFANLCGKRILLTGDAGVRSLTEAHQVVLQTGKLVAPLDWFQVPHHGSRRNLSSDVLDKWLGAKLPTLAENDGMQAIISANQNDSQHPKKAVVRALIHRGRRVFQTSGTLHLYTSGAPDRGWGKALPLAYPQEQED